MIRFLIKLSLFLFFIFVVVSFFVEMPSGNRFSTQRDNEITTSDVIIAFKEALNELGTFCKRHEKTCKAGKSFLNSLGERARYGAKVVYEYLGRILDNNNMVQSESMSLKVNIYNLTQKNRII
ncbi:DUF5330 domain-containing protein [Bartonella sp. B35(2025)]